MEAKAARHSQKGQRGAARRLTVDKKLGPPKGKPKSSSTFGRSKGSAAAPRREGPFAMSATVPMSGKKADGKYKAPRSTGAVINDLYLSTIGPR